MTITIPEFLLGYVGGVVTVWGIAYVLEVLGWRFRKDTTREGDAMENDEYPPTR